jgi:hypothetical protein
MKTARDESYEGRNMTDFTTNTIELPPRRSFFGRVAGAMALGFGGLLPTQVYAQPAPTRSDRPGWPGPLKGSHRQVTDAYEVYGGAPLRFAYNFIAPNEAENESATAVVILRHFAFPLALNHAMWAKYKIGENLKINDPETKAPAVKNPYFETKPGVLPLDDSAIDRLLARGIVFGACNVALQVQSKLMAGSAGVTPDEAAKEWAANIIPGITVIPSGVWGVNRAQEAGCTYCAGGG